MKNVDLFKQLYKQYSNFKDPEVSGRFLSYAELKPRLELLAADFKMETIGKSFLGVPIESVQIGKGPLKILAWSQMHGNETTTTKSLLDLLRLLSGKYCNSPVLSPILDQCSILIIPMLNPDGAARYTRENVNKVDLNRDAQNLQEVESQVLRRCYESFKPDICFNLHDQRTLFSAGNTNNSATVSFLTPAEDADRKLSPSREKSMQVVAAMNAVLQNFIPGGVGRYDDAFNINCTGDTFQSLGTPTVLFEAGHYKADYPREKTREYITLAITAGLYALASDGYKNYNEKDYHNIPENQKNFFDLILRNARVNEEVVDIAIQYQEKVKGGEIIFVPILQTMEESIQEFGHREIACEGQPVCFDPDQNINENDIVGKILLNNEELSIKPQDIH